MAEISTSILTVEKENAVHIFYELEVAKTDHFHVDVMDGKFVEKNNLELMHEYALALSHITNVGQDVHLMVEDVEEVIDDYIDLNPEYITFHIEATKDKERTLECIKLIKENGIKAGIAINPDTSIDEIKEYLPYIHLVVVMTVVPGKGGQKLIPETLGKITNLKKYIEENDLDVNIEADGGINIDTADSVKEAGADIMVAGTYIISSDNFAEAINKIR